MTAIISECGAYRYSLSRPAKIDKERTQPCYGRALFIMLNPSTADAALDDPTIRRCRAFAHAWGCDGIQVANLYGLRATNPADLWTHPDPIGLENDKWLIEAASNHETVVFAWGANAKPERVAAVHALFRGHDIRCLGVTQSGAPRHPLYIRGDQPLIEWTHP